MPARGILSPRKIELAVRNLQGIGVPIDCVVEDDFPRIVARPNHNVPLTIHCKVTRARSGENLEDVGCLIWTGFDNGLNFIERPSYVKSGLGWLVCRRMRVQPSQEELPVFVPEGSRESPVAEEG